TRSAAAGSGCRFIRSHRCAFAGEQCLLAFQSPAIPTEIAIAADHAVAWHDERQLVRRTCLSDRADGFWLTERSGDFGIAGSLAGRDFLQCPPDPCLERGPSYIERQVEFFARRGDEPDDPICPSLEPRIPVDDRRGGEALSQCRRKGVAIVTE